MQLHFFQIVLIIVAGLFLFNGLWKFIKREQGQSVLKIIYTALIWGGVVFLAVFPDFLRTFSREHGLGESLNVFIFVGFILVFVAIFKLLGSIEKGERNITELVRKEALKDLDKYID